MTKLFRVVSLAVFIMIFMGKAYASELINIKFGSQYTGLAMVSSPVASTSDSWNVIDGASLGYYNSIHGLPSGQSIQLTDSERNPSGAAITVFQAEHINYVANRANAFLLGSVGHDLMNSYAQVGIGSTGIIMISGLPQGVYDIYVYSQNEKNQINPAVHITANQTEMYTTLSNGTVDHFLTPTNYVIGKVYVGADLKLYMTFSGISGQGDINGIQLLYEGLPVPEPTNIVLLGIGGIIVFAYFRHQSKESIA